MSHALSPAPAVIDGMHCPLCGSGNQCAVQAARSEGQGEGTDTLCWCMTVQVPPALRERLPAEARGRSCICPNCVTAAHRAKAAGAPAA